MRGLAPDEQPDDAGRPAGPVIRSECSLFIDVPLGSVVAPGDWITTPAGSRYVVLTSRLVRSRRHAQQHRWQMRVGRLDPHIDVPDDVEAWELRWYRRGT